MSHLKNLLKIRNRVLFEDKRLDKSFIDYFLDRIYVENIDVGPGNRITLNAKLNYTRTFINIHDINNIDGWSYDYNCKSGVKQVEKEKKKIKKAIDWAKTQVLLKSKKIDSTKEVRGTDKMAAKFRDYVSNFLWSCDYTVDFTEDLDMSYFNFEIESEDEEFDYLKNRRLETFLRQKIADFKSTVS